ncbi:uncharacterized protein LOC127591339 isoform X4 [Hippocampus zosterae]|uniref:uncharacterized protein LOC127591339 isoform X4 n=1 Tax=Hippocampus zosterae TaxID=109293 RepID=UPI00223D6DBB|nr:uncharacterized protein LOC127591339 isoform X4 [Hippocampus zosterae]
MQIPLCSDLCKIKSSHGACLNAGLQIIRLSASQMLGEWLGFYATRLRSDSNFCTTFPACFLSFDEMSREPRRGRKARLPEFLSRRSNPISYRRDDQVQGPHAVSSSSSSSSTRYWTWDQWNTIGIRGGRHPPTPLARGPRDWTSLTTAEAFMQIDEGSIFPFLMPSSQRRCEWRSAAPAGRTHVPHGCIPKSCGWDEDERQCEPASGERWMEETAEGGAGGGEGVSCCPRKEEAMCEENSQPASQPPGPPQHQMSASWNQNSLDMPQQARDPPEDKPITKWMEMSVHILYSYQNISSMLRTLFY